MTSTSTDLDTEMRAAFEGNFLDASDLSGKDITVVIESIIAPKKEKDSTGKVIDKTIIAFKGAKKRFIANKTNAKCLSMLFGNKASLWIGKEVTLTTRYLAEAFGQKNVPVVRVKVDADKLTFGMRKKYGAAESFSK
jgi:hypothetical protein